jgi:predicted metal-dependent hydrolase
MSASILQLDGMRVPVEIGGSSRKAKLTVEADGSLRMRAAEDVETDELQQFLISKREWVYHKLAEKELLHYEPVTKELVDGEGFLYLGRSYRLKIIKDGTVARLVRGRLSLPSHLVVEGEQHIVDWYIACGRSWVRPRAGGWAERLRVSPEKLDVADLGRKWGSADSGNRVRLHWATFQLPPPLVDYVLVHELAHLREPHHGPAFWQLVARVMPDYEERKRDVALRGGTLWFGGTA